MFPPSRPIPVGILGATGAVGQRFIQQLQNHPWFKVVAVTGSDRSTGQPFGEVCRWILPDPMPAEVRGLLVQPTLPASLDVPLVFSALPASTAREAEPEYAKKGVAVCSNASAFRAETDVPLLLPEVNPSHTGIIPRQRSVRGWSGLIATNPNCTITGVTVALKPVAEKFGLKRLFIVSMQAISGAGYPGVPSLDIMGNVIPYIGDEENKMETEPRKMLGTLLGEAIEFHPVAISAHANRVPVAEGHTVCISFETVDKPDLDDLASAIAGYLPPRDSADLPFTPHPVLAVSTGQDRPQPRLDVMAGKGMTTTIGRIRPDPLMDYKMVVLSHNTIRGAAGGSIYNAELLLRQGYIPAA